MEETEINFQMDLQRPEKVTADLLLVEVPPPPTHTLQTLWNLPSCHILTFLGFFFSEC